MLDPCEMTLTSSPEEKCAAHRNLIAHLSTENLLLKAMVAELKGVTQTSEPPAAPPAASAAPDPPPPAPLVPAVAASTQPDQE